MPTQKNIEPLFHIDLLTPGIRGIDVRAIKSFAGDVGWRYAKQIGADPEKNRRRNYTPIPVDPEQVNRAYFRRQEKRHGLRMDTGAGHFEKACEAADNFIIQLNRDLLSKQADVAGLKNPVDNCNYSPSRALELMVGPNMSNVVKWEMARKIILAEVASALMARAQNGNVGRKIEEIGSFLDENLYSRRARIAETFEYRVDSHHWKQTLLYVNPQEAMSIPPEQLVIRENVFQARLIDDLRFNMTDMRRKPMESAMAKSLVKALKTLEDPKKEEHERGIVNPVKDVLDTDGIMFVSMGDKDDKNKLIDRVLSVMENFPGGIEVKPDDETDKNRGSSEVYSSTRKQVHVQGLPVPVEFIFFDLESYINTRRHIGRIDPKTLIHTGSAHELYELRRWGDLLNRFYPKIFYPSLDIKGILASKNARLVEELISDNIVPFYRPEPRIEQRGRELQEAAFASLIA